VKWSRGLTPYVLLAMLTLGAGLGVGLGLSEAPETHTGEITQSTPFTFGGGVPGVPVLSKSFNECMAKAAIGIGTSNPSVFKREARKARSKCERRSAKPQR
jgi:hypothetical protein